MISTEISHYQNGRICQVFVHNHHTEGLSIVYRLDYYGNWVSAQYGRINRNDDFRVTPEGERILYKSEMADDRFPIQYD